MSQRDPSLEEFKARLPLGDIVARHVRLARRGRELIGLCPFHQEKTPSFSVVEDKGFFHCFGCGAHGNAIDFVMQIERLDFREALGRLAELTGVPAPRAQASTAPRPDPNLYDAIEAAAAFFQRQLGTGPAALAAAYLRRRGLDPATIAAFRLGYAPADRRALHQALTAQGFAEPLLVESGLLVRPEDGRECYDRFRDRVIFPIGDGRGRIVGFGARALGDARPKYLNSPETPLFAKGSLLYNWAAASAPARQAKSVLVAEGYMDVIAFARAGLPYAVAPLGTAITEEQLKSLWRLADEPVLCLDGDPAGFRAAARAATRALPLLEPGRSLAFALLPPGEDPDSLLAARGPEALHSAIARPMKLVDFLWRSATADGLPATPELRAALELRLRQLAYSVGHPAVRAYYVAAVRERLDAAGLGRERWKNRNFRSRWGERRDVPLAPTIATRSSAPERLPGRKLLRSVLLKPQMLLDCEEAIAALGDNDPQLGELCGEILAWYAQTSDLDANLLVSHLTRYGFGELVDHVLAHRPWVRGALAESVDGVAAPDGGQALGRAVTAQHGSDAGPAETEAAGDGQFRTLYRILRSMGDEDGGEGRADQARG